MSSYLTVLALVSGVLAPQDPDAKAEQAAAGQLEAARQAFAKKKMEPAWKGLMALRRDFGKTKVVEAASKDIARMRLVVGLEVVGAGAAFHGIVEAKGSKQRRRLKITYDMTDPESSQDFEGVSHLEDLYPLQTQGGILRGTGAWCHRALFRGDIKMEIEGVAPTGRDVGIVCVDPEAKKTRFAIGVFGNTFFGIKYDKTATVSQGHILLFAGKGAESLDTQCPSQLLAQSRTPPLKEGQSLHGVFEWKKTSLLLRMPPTRLKLRASLSRSTQDIRRKRIGIHVRRARFQPKRIVIEGMLDPKWAEQEIKRIRASLKE